MTVTLVLAVVDDLDIAHIVRDEIGQRFIVGFGGKHIQSFSHPEPVIEPGDEVNGPLTLHFVIECGIRDSVDSSGISKFLKERRLIVKSCSKPESHVLVLCGDDCQRQTGTEETLFVETPSTETDSVIECIECASG